MDDLIGRTLGRYEITALVGRGGMATVYKARHAGLNRTVAVKVLHRHLAVDSAFVGRFRREARAVAALRHPNIVRVHDFDNEGDIYFIVMEFIDGPTLGSFLKRLFKQGRHLSPGDVLRLFSPLCSAIDYAHQRGMVHRDIKPSNIILTREQEPILTDYGIARIAGATAYTIPGVVIGSAHYMSPEQAEGLPGDHRSDIYSLGIVLFEALTGSVPFQGETPMSVIIKHVSATPPSALSLNPDLPPAIEAVLNKALAKDPNDRYQQGSDLALALQEVFGQAAEPAAAAAETTTVEEPTVRVTRQMTPPPPSAGQPTRVMEPTVVTEAGLTIPPAPVRRRRTGLSRLPPFVLAAAVTAVAVVFVVPLIVIGAVLLNEENGRPAAPELTATGSVQPAAGQPSPAAPTATAAAIATSITTAVAIATPTPPDFSAFAKGWWRHGFGLTIDANGQGGATWRVYKWCSDDPTPPCDAVVENQIIAGGTATLAFDRVDGATAFGRVVSSNDEPMFALDSEVLLTLLPYDMATLRYGFSEMTLCGPDFADLAPTAVFETFPCGA